MTSMKLNWVRLVIQMRIMAPVTTFGAIYKIICILTIGFTLSAIASQVEAASPESVTQAMTKRAIEAAPQNFAAIRGTEPTYDDHDGYIEFDPTPDYLAITTGSSIAFPNLKIEHHLANEYSGDLWSLHLEFSTTWSRDTVLARVRSILDPIIPNDFVYKGIYQDPPDDINFYWAGPNNVYLRVHSGVLDTRYVNIEISHELPK